MSLTLFPALKTLFLLLGCLVQPLYEGLCLVVVYRILLCLVVVSLGACSLLKGNRGRMDLVGDGRSGGRGKYYQDELHERRIYLK